VRGYIARKYVVLVLVLFIVPISTAQITLKLYEPDDVTPIDGIDIMVGSKMSLIVSSDANDYWSGGLFIRGQDRALATLYGRDSDPNIRDYTKSHYPAAGSMAKVTKWTDSYIWGFDLYGSDINATAGDWFVIDYEAVDFGDPNVEFYDYGDSWYEPNLILTFHHVPTRDFNDDEVVDISDCTILASYWLLDNCDEPDWCGGTDIDRDGIVDMVDFALFDKFWLWGLPPVEPNIVPDVIFSIVDANGLSEITIDANESITLYVNMTAVEYNSINIFGVEVNISDPNAGSIDNRAYDPNNPPGPGTARILAEPRTSFFDYWGPGRAQEEGIELSGVNFGAPISDGRIASFVFTCDGQGDVTLNLINWITSYTAKLESIVIHQNEPD